jgi:uncharacterized protein YyaL (SSP411 family)
LALLRAYLNTGERRYLDRSLSVADFCDRALWDSGRGAYVDFTPGSDIPRLGEGKVDVSDAHLMSANSLAVLFLEDLALATGNEAHHRRARALLMAGAERMPGRAFRAASYVLATDRWQRGRLLVAIVGQASDLAAAARRVYVPWACISEAPDPPWFADVQIDAPCAVVRLPSGVVRIIKSPVELESELRSHR